MEQFVILALVISNAVMAYSVYKMSNHISKYKEAINQLRSKAVTIQTENNSLKRNMKLQKETEKILMARIAEYENKSKKISEFFKTP